MFNHTPASRQTVGGTRLCAYLDQLESGNNRILAEISTMMETIDGGEDNALDETKLTRTVSVYGFIDTASAKAAIGQLQAIRFALTNTDGQAALVQAFNRLRG